MFITLFTLFTYMTYVFILITQFKKQIPASSVSTCTAFDKWPKYLLPTNIYFALLL